MNDRDEPHAEQPQTVDVSPGANRRRSGSGGGFDSLHLTGAELQGLEVRERIGQGGMGAVYRAWDPQLERFVAIKVIAPREGDDDRFVSRFLREARAACAVQHPSVAQVYSVGTHEGCPFLVMELIDGSTLAELAHEQGRLGGSRSLEYLIQACEGLEAGHRAGVIHRDIKPGNLMVDRSGSLKIVDFGLARRVETDVTLTDENTVVGTPAYMSPEQALGKSVDHRSDIYSLGATFYHVLSGKPPFEGDTAIEVATQHVTRPLPPLAGRNPAIPRPLCAVIERMMAKQPEHRYESYGPLLSQLRSIRARQSDVAESVVVVAQPRRSPLVLGAVVVAAVLFGLWLGRPGKESPAAQPRATELGSSLGSRSEAAGSSAVVPPPPPRPEQRLEPLPAPPLEQGVDWSAAPQVQSWPEGPDSEPSDSGDGDPEALTTDAFWSLASAIGAYRQRYGSAPSDLAALADAGLLASDATVDGWGSPIHYVRERSGRYHVVSPGADHLPRTSDDLYFDGSQVGHGPPPGPKRPSRPRE